MCTAGLVTRLLEIHATSARTATAGTSTARPGRQPAPAATAAPTTSGAIAPTPAATALASLIAAGPAAPWWSASVATTPLTTSEPARAARSAAAMVAGNGRAAHNARTPTASPATPVHITGGRPKRRTSGGKIVPPT